ncbi:response regulator transcription factor [Natrononativus amylolyticus]|uniref:response regulator transcription factor n=1 Tax=Natrononativus amylolyticus TaxID=2963434 RepID=UPI0020CC8F7B|nr:response regulator [Natrononativus amylolyticus]
MASGGCPLSDPTVLIADDERQLTDVYAQWVEDRYTTRTAYCGDEAMELLDETVDIAVLDRQMPGCSGEEIVTKIRNSGYDCRTALISANEPTLEMVDVEYDLYQVKPLTDPDEFQSLLEALCRRSVYDPETQRVLALASKKRDLEAYVAESRRQNSSQYDRLCDELEALSDKLTDVRETLEAEGLSLPF